MVQGDRVEPSGGEAPGVGHRGMPRQGGGKIGPILGDPHRVQHVGEQATMRPCRAKVEAVCEYHECLIA